MIKLKLSTKPLNPGESRELKAWSDFSGREATMSVAIQCFVEPPDPAELQPCSACGEFRLTNGQSYWLLADEKLFATGGFLKITIIDGRGEKLERTIVVSKNTSGLDRGLAVAG